MYFTCLSSRLPNFPRIVWVDQKALQSKYSKMGLLDTKNKYLSHIFHLHSVQIEKPKFLPFQGLVNIFVSTFI